MTQKKAEKQGENVTDSTKPSEVVEIKANYEEFNKESGERVDQKMKCR